MKSIFADALLIAGTAAIVYGVWLFSKPAGIILGGLFVAAAGALISYNQVPSRRRS